MIILLFTLAFGALGSAEGFLVLSQVNDAVQGKSFQLKCKTSDLSKQIFFKQPSGDIAGSCTNGQCGSGLGFGLHQDGTNAETVITIPVATRSIHQGNWSCSFGTTEETLSVVILTVPSEVIIQGLSTDIQVEDIESYQLVITCSCSCAYPSVTFEWKFIDTGNNSTLYAINSTGERDVFQACGQPSELAYKKNFVLDMTKKFILLPRRNMRVQCTAYIPFITKTSSPFSISQGTIVYPEKTTTQNDDSLSGGAIAGIVLGVIAALAVFALVTAFVVRSQKRPQSRTKETEYFSREGDKVTYCYNPGSGNNKGPMLFNGIKGNQQRAVTNPDRPAIQN